MGANARDITPSSASRSRRPRRRASKAATWVALPADQADAIDLVDDLRALLCAGLIEPTADYDGTVRYRAVADHETEENGS